MSKKDQSPAQGFDGFKNELMGSPIYTNLIQSDKKAFLRGAEQCYELCAKQFDLAMSLEQERSDRHRDAARQAKEDLRTIADILDNARSEA
jgi:hypothetical protein